MKAGEREFRFICVLARSVVGLAAPDEVAARARKVDWNRVLQLQQRHGLPNLVARGYPDASSLPRWVTRQIKDASFRHAQRALWQVAELREIALQAQEQRLPFISLKGVALSHRLFGEALFRAAKDLDLICQEPQLTAFIHLLQKRGYEQFGETRPGGISRHHIVFRHPQKGTLIELHTRFFNSPQLFPEQAAVWDRVSQIELSGQTIPVLGKEDLFLYLVLHGAQHAWSRLKWILDVAALIQQEDRSEFRLEDHDYRRQPACRQVGLLLRKLFRFHPPGLGGHSPSYLEGMQLSISLRRLRCIDPALTATRGEALFYRLLIRSGLRYKGSVIWHGLMTTLERK